jgi:hypothetical protein
MSMFSFLNVKALFRSDTQAGRDEPPPDERPRPGPKGPRTPYPVDQPPDPNGPGSAPDVFPGKPANPLPKF